MRAIVLWRTRKAVALSLSLPSLAICKTCRLRPPWKLKYGRKDERSP